MSSTTPITFRPARPADADAAIPLILSSGPDAFNYVFRTATQEPSAFLRRAFTDGAGEFGYRNHVVGASEGHVVAAGAGWSSASNFAFSLAAARQFIAFFGPLLTPLVILRGLRTEAIIRPPAAGEWYVGHLGVDPARRGQGIGEALIAHLLAAGTEAGFHKAILDVAITNPRAEALYARLGFQVTVERASTLHRPEGFVPGSRRMERPI
jgi:ribosomal protein S18 acetylase RimI-like enzyme